MVSVPAETTVTGATRCDFCALSGVMPQAATLLLARQLPVFVLVFMA
jgi:hypothetical protein